MADAGSTAGHVSKPLAPPVPLNLTTPSAEQRSSYNSSVSYSGSGSSDSAGAHPKPDDAIKSVPPSPRIATSPLHTTAFSGSTQATPASPTIRTPKSDRIAPPSSFPRPTPLQTSVVPSISSSSTFSSNDPNSSLPSSPYSSLHPELSPPSPSKSNLKMKHLSPMSPKAMGASATKFLRRVASAPNAKGLFSSSSSSGNPAKKNGFLAPADDLEPVPPLPFGLRNHNGVPNASSLDTVSSEGSLPAPPPRKAKRTQSHQNLRAKPSKSTFGSRLGSSHSSNSLSPSAAFHGKGRTFSPAVPSESTGKIAFRRTYSSNSIKTKEVEVTPSSFVKIKMLGKGDVGKVYLVREKKTEKLFAMKGRHIYFLFLQKGNPLMHLQCYLRGR